MVRKPPLKHWILSTRPSKSFSSFWFLIFDLFNNKKIASDLIFRWFLLMKKFLLFLKRRDQKQETFFGRIFPCKRKISLYSQRLNFIHLNRTVSSDDLKSLAGVIRRKSSLQRISLRCAGFEFPQELHWNN